MLVHLRLVLMIGLLSFSTTLALAGDETGAEVEAPAPPEGKARIVIPQEEFNFGTIRADKAEPITHSFEFKNEGEEPLILTNVKPSCGCTGAVLSATEVAPNATATLTATLNTKSKHGRTSISVRVVTNDPTEPNATFRMVGTVLSGWRVIPARVDFGSLGKGEVATRDLSISSQYVKDDPVHRIRKLLVDKPFITAATVEENKPDVQPPLEYTEIRRIVRIEMTTPQEPGDGMANLQIATDDPQNPTHTVVISWRVDGDITFTPNKLFISDIRGRKRTPDLVLESRTHNPFDIVAIDVEGKGGTDDVVASVREDASKPDRKVIGIDFNFEIAERTETRSGNIVIHTNLAELPEITIPYTAIMTR